MWRQALSETPSSASLSPPHTHALSVLVLKKLGDTLRDEFAAQLPGQAWSALRRIEVGDFAAAEAVLPGGFAPILTGPGGRARRRRWRVAAAIAVLATVAAAVVAALGGGR